MADNTRFSAGTADGDTYGSDDIAGIKFARMKLIHGADGTNDGDVANANPLPIKITDGTDVALVDGSGNLQVAVNGTVTVGSHAVTNAGTFATQVDGAALTALQLIDDPVATLGTTTYTETSTKGVIVGAVRRDADTTLVDTTNEIGPLQMDANGRLKVEAFSGETLPVSLASVPSHAVTNAGTFAVQDSEKVADDAAFTVATTKVLPVGFLADETSPDSVDEGDVGAARMTLDRMIRVVTQDQDTVRANGTSRAVTRTAVAAATSGNNTLVTNSNGGLTLRVYAMTIVAAAAVSLYFTADAGGTVIFGGSTNKISLAANSGIVLPYNPLGWFETSANTDIVMNLSGAVAVSGVIITAEV